ncbi:MAG: NAD-dependent epimerase/dehydratase family protein, partial [Candidatus Omnitrophica bacterium]|nr:NAD-dependent epimerase/dehydratase family protein [Candidatus Omnitrophota bacterium]
MKKSSKIFVAGGTGLVGSALIRVLRKKEYKNIVSNYFSKNPTSLGVKFYKLDLRSQKDTEEFFKKERPQYVFLAAAKVGGILANLTYTAEFIYDNL